MLWWYFDIGSYFSTLFILLPRIILQNIKIINTNVCKYLKHTLQTKCYSNN